MEYERQMEMVAQRSATEVKNGALKEKETLMKIYRWSEDEATRIVKREKEILKEREERQKSRNNMNLKRRKMQTMTFVSAYGSKHELVIQKTTYATNGRLALRLILVDGNYTAHYATLTVNLPQADHLDEDCAFVDTNNIPNADTLIRVYKLGKPTGRYVSSGFCLYPEYKFNMDEVNKYRLYEEGEEK